MFFTKKKKINLETKGSFYKENNFNFFFFLEAFSESFTIKLIFSFVSYSGLESSMTKKWL